MAGRRDTAVIPVTKRITCSRCGESALVPATQEDRLCSSCTALAVRRRSGRNLLLLAMLTLVAGALAWMASNVDISSSNHPDPYLVNEIEQIRKTDPEVADQMERLLPRETPSAKSERELKEFAGTSSRWFFLIMLALLLQPLFIPPHELAHALTARALRFRVSRISLGLGKPFTTFHIGTTAVDLGVPTGGYTACTTDRRSHYRLRAWLLVFAGPLSTAALFVLFLAWQPPTGWQVGAHSALLIATGVLVGQSLIPHRPSAKTGLPRESDGLRLLTIPKMDDAAVDQAIAMHDALLTIEQTRRGGDVGRDQVLTSLQALVGAGQGSPAVRNLLSQMLIVDRRHAEALEVLTPLANGPPPGNDGAVAMNNAAWCELMVEGDLGRADRWSARALLLDPDDPFFQGTRGAVLVESGRYAEGVDLLRRARAAHTAPRSVAAVLAWEAIAAARTDDPARATELRREVARLDPESTCLPFVDRALGVVSPA